MVPDRSGSRGTLLLVDDEESTGRLARRHFPGWTVVQAFTLAEASAHLETAHDLRLVLLDLNLADTVYVEPLLDNPFQGSFDLARRIRRTHPTLPVVIFSAHVNGAIVNAAHLAGAALISKQDAAENLDLLHRRLDQTHPSGGRDPIPYLAWLREHRGMTPRESEVAALAVQGITSYAELGERLGISPNTVKRHVTSLLDRSGADSLFDFILRALGISP